MSEGNCARKNGEILEQRERLEAGQAKLHEVITQLEAQLIPIMEEGGPDKPATPPSPMECMSGLGRQLEGQNTDLARAIQRLMDIQRKVKL